MKWIWKCRNGEDEVNQYVRFSDFFDAFDDERTSKYVLRISADTRYTLFVNGVKAAHGQYADLPDYKVYDETDISEHVIYGRNQLEFLIYYQGANSSTYAHGIPGFCFSLEKNGETVAESSEKTLWIQDSHYRSGPIDMITGQLGYSFEYDASSPDDFWQMSVDLGLNPLFTESFDGKDAPGAIQVRNIYKRPTRMTECLPAIDVKVKAQGIFRYDDPDEFPQALRLEHAFLSTRNLHEITEPALPNYHVLKGDGSSVLKLRNTPSADVGTYLVLDLGHEEAGFLSLDLEAAKGTEIYFAFGEHLDDLRVRSYVGTRCFAGKYTVKGDGREHFTNYIRRLGLRYLQLYIFGTDVTIHYAGIVPELYPLEVRGSFSTSDALHQKIYDTSVRTLRLCMHEHYEDCPWREQALYSFDGRNQMLAGYYAFGEYDFPKACIRLLGKTLRSDAQLELCAPAKIPITIPSFTLTWIVDLYEYVLYSGDIEFAADYFPHVNKIIRAFWRNAGGSEIQPPLTGSQYWNFYEWTEYLDNSQPSSDENVKYDAPLTLFYIWALDAANRLARWLNKEHSQYDSTDYRELGAWYEMLRDSAAAEFNKKFWNDKEGVYADFYQNGERFHYSELTNSMAVYTGAVSEKYKGRVLAALAGKTDAKLSKITLSHTIFKYESFMREGGEYADYVIKDIEKQWGAMLASGATSFWETQDGAPAFDNAGSLCHGWSAVPAYIYMKYVLGVSPSARGFETIKTAPVKTHLTDIFGKVPCPGGVYNVSFTSEKYRVVRK